MRLLEEDYDTLEDEDYEEDTLKDKYLTFRLAPEEYAIDIQYVTEIVGIQPITEIPDMEKFIKGVMNLRGKIVPVVDVRLRFQLPARTYNDRTCIIVVNMSADAGSMTVGLVVDEVSDVLTIPATQISDPPKISKGSQGRYIRGIGKVGEEVKMILNLQNIFSASESEELLQAAA
jgi:purine-binding chemotaxis protein CheW